MLVLNRKVREVVEIDNGRIKVYVVAILDGRVRLGFKAPPEVPIHRAEVAKRIDLEECDG